MKTKLKEVYLFKNLCDETLEKIAEFTSFLKLSKDNVLFYEGEESKYLYLLKKGIVKLYKTSSNDKEIILKYFHSNEFIAEVANFERLERYVELLERAAQAMSVLAELEKNGKLEKIANAIK